MDIREFLAAQGRDRFIAGDHLPPDVRAAAEALVIEHRKALGLPVFGFGPVTAADINAAIDAVQPDKCHGWINLASVVDTLRPLTSVIVHCDVPAGGQHPTDGDGDPLHQYKTIYWGARSVPEEGDG